VSPKTGGFAGIPATLDSGPIFCDGGIERLMTDGITVWVESWGKNGWVFGGGAVSDFFTAPPASKEVLAKFGVPPESITKPAPGI
jgi:hypothetical protein